MSFSKSKVSRFGEKMDSTIFQRTSATELSNRSRESSRSQKSAKSGKIGVASSSFSGISNPAENEQKLSETQFKLKSQVGKHSCFSSKIGRPNLLKKKQKTGPNAEIDGIVQKDSYTTVESTKSNPPSSRIPSKSPPRSRASSLGTSRAGSFVGAPGSNYKSDANKRSMEMQFSIKSKRLNSLKKELLEKQKPAVELYKALINMRNRFKDLEGKELPMEELKIVEYPDIKSIDDKQKEMEEEKLKDLKSKLQSTPQAFMELCRQTLDGKCGILDEIFDDEGEWSQDDLIKKIQHYKEESAKLVGQIESRLMEEEGKMKDLIREWYQIAKIHAGEFDKGSNTEIELKLQETEHKLKQAMADLTIEKAKKHKELIDRNKDLEGQLSKMKEKYLEANKSLEEERTKSLCQKERQTFLEHKMKTAKGRMKEAELQKQELELQVENLSALIKKNEEEWNSKEIYLDARHSELQQLVRSHKEDLEKLERDRHSVDVRFEEQRKEFELKERDYEDKIKQLESELNELKTQKITLETENDMLRVKAVKSEVYSHMHNANKKMLELEETPVKSKTEMALWSELKETKSALKLAEEKLSIYAEEKTRFLDTISESFKEDDTTSVHMTSQLMQKEELISTLILQNKQLQDSLDEIQAIFDQKCEKQKELENKLREVNDQLFDNDVDTEKEIYDLHAKLQYEIERNKELEEKVIKANDDNHSAKEMILDYENLLKIRDGLLNMMQDKKNSIEEQNKSLKDYIVQMREQLNLLSIDKSKKEQELKTMSMLLEEKTGYIDKIEERVAELEASVQEIKLKRVNLQEQICNADGELRVTRDKISRLNKRESLLQFINHAQNLCTQEAMRFRKRLHSRLALRSSVIMSAGPARNSSRPQSAQSCTLDKSRKTTKMVTTVSDIMRRYKSNEGFDLKAFSSCSSFNN